MLASFNASSASIETVRALFGGSYTLNGTTTANTFDLRGATVSTSLFVNAGDGNDTLFGSTAAETLRGDGGNDSINSGAGNDTVTGGSGADTFVYRAGHGADTATDFRRTDGDKIDLAGVAGITSFAALQAKITQSSPNTVIDFGNGDTLTLTGVNATSLLASDFIIAGAGGNIIPTAVTLVNATSAIAENTSTATRVKIADITVTDDVLGTNTLGLTGADAASFEIVGTSLFLKAGTALNFETKQSYAVAVTVDDTAVGTTPDAVSATFALSITDVNEAPTVLSLAGNSIAENSAPGTTVGPLSVVDEDAQGAPTYTLSDPANNFEITSGNRISVKTGAVLDFEANPTFSVKVTATDAGGLTKVETFTIFLTNVSDSSLVGTSGSDNGLAGLPILSGTSGPDFIYGLAGNDVLLGSGGNDVLDGGADADTLQGGQGNDIYVIDNAGDTITENVAEGSDTVRTNFLRAIRSARTSRT